jgi:pyruvate kinase
LASSAVKTSIDIHAAFILVLSESGASARNVSKFRSGRHVVVLTPNEAVARQCSGVIRGAHAYVVDSLEDTNALVAETCRHAVDAGIAKEGDSFVVVCGQHFGAGANNQIKVETVTLGSPRSTGGDSTVGHFHRGLSFTE